MKNIISKDKKTIEKITDILHKNGIEYYLTHQYSFVDGIKFIEKDTNKFFLVYHLQYSDIKLKKVFKNQINEILLNLR